MPRAAEKFISVVVRSQVWRLRHCLSHGLSAISVACVLGSVVATAQTFTVLANFDGSNGAYPQYGSLVQGRDGDLWGTTGGGGSGSCSSGCGTVFRMSRSGTLQTYSFISASGSDPQAGVVLGTDGNLYGVTYKGGANNDGTVFKVTPENGTITTLLSFDNSNGSSPAGALAQGRGGQFYGTTALGDTVFKITPTGTLTTLYNLNYSTDGGDPWGQLLQGSDGEFYGTNLPVEAGAVGQERFSKSLLLAVSLCFTASLALPPTALIHTQASFWAPTGISTAQPVPAVPSAQAPSSKSALRER